MTAVLASREQHSQFSPDPRRAPTTQRYFLQTGIPTKTLMQDEDSARDCSPASLSSLPPSPSFTPPEEPPYTPTTVSTLSLDEDLILPTYDGQSDSAHKISDVLSDLSEGMAPVRTCGTPAADDSSVEDEPSRHVDYLSHDWREEDIWASWRYVAARRNDYSNGPRLENASWRTWAKAKKQPGDDLTRHFELRHCRIRFIPPPSRLETPTLYHDRKPILKKKTASETILQRSLSQHTLLQHAGAILQAQEAENGWARPPLDRSNTDIDRLHQRTGSSTHSLGNTLTTTSSSGLTSPSERRHIHFNDEVEQCIAVECKGEEDEWPFAVDDESSSDEGFGLVSPHLSLLPLSPSPSVETLRPAPAANFLLDDDDEDPSLDFTGQYRNPDRTWFVPEGEDAQTDRPLQLTDSGMFMPYGEGEGEASSHTILGRVVDTVNTARDIAHLIWNVGWRR
ncbi:hypothetical protein N7470_007350 [Penicillium chermesinum]|nr:hypothetical protein N7470_007350 [Penicillium chermesinum]